MYDYIFIGGSISNLLEALSIDKTKQILIVEKDIKLGGAWNIKSNNLCSHIDTGCHLIVPRNNNEAKKIMNFLEMYNIKMKFIDSKNLLYETPSFSYHGKNATPIVPCKGWGYFCDIIINLVISSNNIKVKKDTEIIKIVNSSSKNIIYGNNSVFKCNKLIIPTYVNINSIYCHDNIIDLPMLNIENKHVIMYLHTDIFNYDSEFHAFLDKEPIGIFDRASVVSQNKNEFSKILSNNINLVLLARISKNYKNVLFDNSGTTYLNYLIDKNILSGKTKVIKCEIFKYKCAYRTPDMRDEIHKKLSNIKNIEFLDTFYMGHFLGRFI